MRRDTALSCHVQVALRSHFEQLFPTLAHPFPSTLFLVWLFDRKSHRPSYQLGPWGTRALLVHHARENALFAHPLAQANVGPDSGRRTRWSPLPTKMSGFLSP